MKFRRIGATKKKILLCLSAGLQLTLVRTPGRTMRILKNLEREWRFVGRQRLLEIMSEFRNDRLVSFRELDNGEIAVILSERGKKRSIQRNLDSLKLKQKPWDGYWRIVIFDIPEENKKAREAFREKLMTLGFKPVQKSVFIHYLEARDEIDFLVEVFDVRSYVRYGILKEITNAAELKYHFNL